MTRLETQEYQNPLEKPENKESRMDSMLDTDMKTGGKDIQKSMDTLAEQEIDAIKSNFSPDEFSNTKYIQQFANEQKNLTRETQEILAGPEKPEEKMKSLGRAFEEFQSKVAGIKGTKEGMDAQRGTQNAENMRKEGKDGQEKGQKFKESLLKNIQEQALGEAKKQREMAEYLAHSTQLVERDEAEKSMNTTLAFGPPGHSEQTSPQTA